MELKHSAFGHGILRWASRVAKSAFVLADASFATLHAPLLSMLASEAEAEAEAEVSMLASEAEAEAKVEPKLPTLGWSFRTRQPGARSRHPEDNEHEDQRVELIVVWRSSCPVGLPPRPRGQSIIPLPRHRISVPEQNEGTLQRKGESHTEASQIVEETPDTNDLAGELQQGSRLRKVSLGTCSADGHEGLTVGVAVFVIQEDQLDDDATDAKGCDARGKLRRRGHILQGRTWKLHGRNEDVDGASKGERHSRVHVSWIGSEKHRGS
eukprot:scaffold770_cov255-Pinguiococcus_pyrenoidosus.AAC.46